MTTPPTNSWEEKLHFEILEDYIREAEYGYMAKDKPAYYERMRGHFEKLKAFIASEREEAYETGHKDGENSRAADISFLLDEDEQAAMKLIREEAKRDVLEELSSYCNARMRNFPQSELHGKIELMYAALTHQKPTDI